MYFSVSVSVLIYVLIYMVENQLQIDINWCQFISTSNTCNQLRLTSVNMLTVNWYQMTFKIDIDSWQQLTVDSQLISIDCQHVGCCLSKLIDVDINWYQFAVDFPPCILKHILKMTLKLKNTYTYICGKIFRLLLTFDEQS